MAKKKIESKDVVANNLFDPTIKSANELLESLNAIEAQLKDLLKASLALARNKPLSGYDGVEDTERGLGGVKKASEGLAKVERDRRRLLKQLTDLANDQSIANEELRQRANQLRKEQRELAKENIGLTDEYTRQSKELNKNRRAYKNLFLETEKNRKGLKGLIFRFTSAGKELRRLEISAELRQIGRAHV